MTAGRGMANRMIRAAPLASGWERIARLLALAIIGAMAIVNVVWTIQTWPMGDFGTYWTAAERIREGGPLYVGDDPLHSYRYAPWFAWLWVPLTLLPREVVAIGWEIALLAATVAVAIPYLNRAGLPLALLLVPLLFAVTAGGNVQALLICALLYGIDRHSGPLWIAVAASLKATPILLVSGVATAHDGLPQARRHAGPAAAPRSPAAGCYAVSRPPQAGQRPDSRTQTIRTSLAPDG